MPVNKVVIHTIIKASVEKENETELVACHDIAWYTVTFAKLDVDVPPDIDQPYKLRSR